MLLVCSDTHSQTAPAVRGQFGTDLTAAEVVCHAGDFTTASALDTFQEAADRLFAVHGNADSAAVRDRLPEARTLSYGGVRIAMTHRRDGGPTGLAMFGRSRGASLVISGHTHQPAVTEAGDVTLLNPGSHADPRGNRPGYAVLEPADDGLQGTIREPDGTEITSIRVDATDQSD